jgi:hypothetical protein
MNPKNRIIALILVLVFVTASSCNLPAGVPQQAQNQTPDLTITALSEFISTAQAAQTGVPIQELVPTATATATAIPLATVQPTASPAPTQETGITEPASPTETEEPTDEPESSDSKRSKTSISATYLQEEPDIDGDFDEWDLTVYDVDEIAYGDNRLGNDKDLSGTVMVAWDDFYLYIAVDVNDDEYEQRATGKYLFRGDSIEFLIDTDVPDDFSVRSLNSDDFQVGISPGKSEPSEDTEAYLWYPRSKASRLNDVDAVAKETDDGYRLEARIPWEILDVSPDIDMHFGFAFSISDNDKNDENVQQSMLSTVSGRRLTDPTTWGDLVLEGHE